MIHTLILQIIYIYLSSKPYFLPFHGLTFMKKKIVMIKGSFDEKIEHG